MKVDRHMQSVADAALEYAGRGWHVFPVPPGTKSSYKSAKYSGGRQWGATTDPDEIRRDWQRWPDANIGIACEPSRLVVLDLDRKNEVDGVQWLADEIEARGDWPLTIEATSPSGGWHVYFQYPDNFDPKTCEGQIAPGVDVRAHGGMVLAAPSEKPGSGHYRWKNPPGFFEAEAAPGWLLDMLPRREDKKVRQQSQASENSGPKLDAGGGAKSIEDYRRLILDASTDGKKHGATRDIAASLAAQGVSESFATGLIQAVCPIWDDNLQSSIATAYEKYRGSAFRLNGFELVRDDKDRPIWCAANAETLLTEHQDWQGVFAYNAFTVRRMIMKPVPGVLGGDCPRPLSDDDYTAVTCWFNRHGFPKATSAIVEPAVRKTCTATTYDPLTDFLTGLKWDGTYRIGSWLSEYCGAEATEYAGEAGKRWLISAVARAFQPGCKADHMLVLEGAQGKRKSTALATLTGADWFTDALPAMGTKDASSFLRGKWIIEVGELEAMRREVDAIKAFISRQVETFRPAYGREEVTEPRRCVFAGTTNKDDWQRDETGGRRFWPVKVGDIDIEKLARDREQLWAEAVVAYSTGQRWWLDGVAEAQAKEEVAQRRTEDPWTGDIARIVSGRSKVSPKEILAEMNFDQRDMTAALAKRVSQELVSMGWTRHGRHTSGPLKGAAIYVPAAGEGE